jgi:hypothetical protein
MVARLSKSVEGGQDDEHDGEHEHDLSDSLMAGVDHTGGGAQTDVFDEDGDDAGYGDGHAEGAERGAAGSAGEPLPRRRRWSDCRLGPLCGKPPGEANPRATMSATLNLTREAAVTEVFPRGAFDVFVDDKGLGSVESDGGRIETPVPPGRRTLQVRERRHSSRELSFQATMAKSSGSDATNAGSGRSGSRHSSCRSGPSSSVRVLWAATALTYPRRAKVTGRQDR